MLPEVGKTYTDDKGNTRHVVKVTNSYVDYHKNGKAVYNRMGLSSFTRMCMPNEPFKREYLAKPLDQAIKELDKQFCRHKNVRKDYFFSAMVYLTCKDCGKPLN